MRLRNTRQGFKSSDKDMRELTHKLDLIESKQKDYAKIIEKIVGFKIRNYNTYQPRIVIKEGPPDPNEGIEGIFSLRKLQRGIFLFIYYRDKWWKVTQLTDFTHQGNTNTQNNPTMAASMADEAFSNLAINGKLNINPVAASSDTDKFLVSDNGEIKFRTGAQVLSDTSTAASTSVSGVVELATIAETNTGTATDRAVTPDGLEDWTGSGNIVETGVLDGGSITSGFGAIDNGSSNITTTGTITSGNGVSGRWCVNGANNINYRLSSVNTYYVSNRSLGTGITTGDFTYLLYPYAQFIAQQDVKLQSWTYSGSFSSGVDYEIELWDTSFTAAASSADSATKVGDTQSISAVATRLYSLKDDDLDYTVAAGHLLWVIVRYTSGFGTKQTYGSVSMEFTNA